MIPNANLSSSAEFSSLSPNAASWRSVRHVEMPPSLETEENELTSTVFVAKVREPPHVPEANDLSCHSQQELNFAGPLSSAIGAGCWVAFHHLKFELALWTKMGIHRSATIASE